MKFKQIRERLTGISCPIFGISWNPPESECTQAKRILHFLEDRRILYNNYDLELPPHCIESVIRIREFLTSELSQINEKTPLYGYTKGMRIAARKFVNSMQAQGEDFIQYARHSGNISNWTFISSLGELRGTFGNFIAQLAASYGLEIEDDLAIILPGKDDSEALLNE